MQIVNFMEETVKRSLEELLSEPTYLGLKLDGKGPFGYFGLCLESFAPKVCCDRTGTFVHEG